MANFLTNLWESVFTAGPTPTLLIATNVTFGTLQALLFGLLLATYSVHFAILSVLCGGLWYSINWFSGELRQAQDKEAEAERLRKRKQAERVWRAKGEVGDSADDEGDMTEVEPENVSLERGKGGEEEVREQILEAVGGRGSSSLSKVGGKVRQRRGVDDGDKSASEISTDSEWEKVDDA